MGIRGLTSYLKSIRHETTRSHVAEYDSVKPLLNRDERINVVIDGCSLSRRLVKHVTSMGLEMVCSYYFLYGTTRRFLEELEKLNVNVLCFYCDGLGDVDKSYTYASRRGRLVNNAQRMQDELRKREDGRGEPKFPASLPNIRMCAAVVRAAVLAFFHGDKSRIRFSGANPDLYPSC